MRFNSGDYIHAFILGQSGSGKSVLLNNIITSAINKYAPEDLMLYLMDFKGVEFNRYRGIRHAKAEQSEAIFELSGDEREPIRDIRIEDVHVGLLTQFESRTSFVEGLTVRDVVYDNMANTDGGMSISGIAPGR